jgi:ethanolaminephosphotransferase
VIDQDLHEMPHASHGDDDIRRKNPHDRHLQFSWLLEPRSVDGVLTQDGVTQIAFHQYNAGTYTALDTVLNPVWMWLTERLPRTVAPNLVTLIGGLHCLAAYLVTWRYTPHFTDPVPNWVLLVNAYCCAAYYTLDCMDGKQARRTGTSSPAGQLFDHGMDCLCLQQHWSMCMAWIGPDAPWLWTAQAGLQFSFYMAQWEEYYTGVLPHATGNVGVTEVNYGLCVMCIVNALIPDRDTLYSQTLRQVVPESVGSTIPETILDLPLKHVLVSGWYLMLLILCTLCLFRVCRCLQFKALLCFGALFKLVSPAMICLAPVLVDADVLAMHVRWISLAAGMALTQITIKLIVLSMARQAVAVIQYRDVLPLVLACFWIGNDSNLKDPGIRLLLQVLTMGYCLRIAFWTRAATRQICERLDIYLLTIKPKKTS